MSQIKTLPAEGLGVKKRRNCFKSIPAFKLEATISFNSSQFGNGAQHCVEPEKAIT